MRRVLWTVLVLAAVAAACRADYLVVSRAAHVKESPYRDAQTVARVAIGEELQLLEEEQSDGYYLILLEDGRRGWIYRTLARRYPGDSEWWEARAHSAPHAAHATLAEASPFAYGGLPVSTDTQFPVTVLRKPFFVIGYSEDRRNPLWVTYAIGPIVDRNAYPVKSFRIDEDTRSRVRHGDYTHQGYSRGHMAPRMAISSRYGRAGNDATFIMSNVCPQYQTFNDGPWGEIEELIAGRKTSTTFRPGWADAYEHVWVIVGPIFDEERTPLDSNVEVPSAFYCIVIDETEDGPRALAFILDHEDTRSSDPVAALRSIREIERRTGLDFCSLLPDDVETALESHRAAELWPLPSDN